MMSPRARIGAATLALALVVSACAADDEQEITDDPSAEDGAMEDEMAMDDDSMDDDSMDGGSMDGDMAMNMGDPDATPADDVEGAALARGQFELLDTRPAGYDDTAGSAVIARHASGTTVTIELTGLEPNVDFISHVHAQACADENGGPHYQFEIGGATTPPNEIHLAFVSDADGRGFMTAESHDIAGLDAVSLVVHPAELTDNKVACADFVEDEAGAAAEAIDAGLG